MKECERGGGVVPVEEDKTEVSNTVLIEAAAPLAKVEVDTPREEEEEKAREVSCFSAHSQISNLQREKERESVCVYVYIYEPVCLLCALHVVCVCVCVCVCVYVSITFRPFRRPEFYTET